MTLREKYMDRCLELARSGLGTTAPNPMVGAVLVYKDRIIGEGFTSPYGGNHAEVNCIASVKEVDKDLISKATLYVSLEPCSHYGKTPPCSDLIVKKEIKKVVVGITDTNTLVNGKGLVHLKDSGCEVITNILREDCYEINKRFFTFHEKKRPYIILKWAVSKDGYIGKNEKEEKKPIWISNTYSQQLVHQWRSEEQAILVGTTTVLGDNPKLDVRHVKGRNPLRLVIDKDLKITKDYHILDNKTKTVVFTSRKDQKNTQNLVFEELDFTKELTRQICDVLYKYNIQSIIVEGGAKTLQSFIDSNLWDEARIFYGDSLLENGVKTPEIKGIEKSKEKIQKDQLIYLVNDKR